MKQIKYRQPYYKSDGAFSHWHYWGWISDGEFIGPLSLGQVPNKEKGQEFTGLKDKNGKEIYEGDIIKHLNTRGFDKLAIGIVEYDVSQAQYRHSKYSEEYLTGYCVEIIGNIYENPELLT